MSSLPNDHATRLERAQLSLEGLSVGDAFGEQFFHTLSVDLWIDQRTLPQPPWPYTDDTEMALGLMQNLEDRGRIHEDYLASIFARRYDREPDRGYGSTAHHILQAIGLGQSWKSAAGEAFDGQGSMGNGAAMRVAPLGAYFADDLSRVVSEATASAAVTHAHPDGAAGAIAIAVAAAWAWRVGSGQEEMKGSRLIEVALEHTPRSETRRGIEEALALPADVSPVTAARRLGSGLRVTSPDTVPFTLWCAARHLDDYVEAMWTTVSGLGDRDTTCAIVGGIIALSAGAESIPVVWREAREALRLRV